MERPIEKIRDINNSIDHVASKIQLINRDRLRDLYKYEKVLQMAIPKIKNKLNDSDFHNKKKNSTTSQSTKLKDKIAGIQSRKKTQQLGISRSREVVKEEKMESSKELRALSRINEQKIKKMKMMVLEEKKRRKDEVKENMEKSRMTVENFYLQKKQYLKGQREGEKEKAKKRIQQLARSILNLENEKNKVLKDRYMAYNELQKMRKTVTKLDRMKLTEFEDLTNEAGLCSQELTVQEVQSFLRYIDENKKKSA